MDVKRLFYGSLYECTDLENYKKYGTSRFVPEIQTRTMMMGFEERYAKLLIEEALLVKMDNGYVVLDYIDSRLGLKLFDMGLRTPHSHKTLPRYNGEEFIEEKTIHPYLTDEDNLHLENISLVKLKKGIN